MKDKRKRKVRTRPPAKDVAGPPLTPEEQAEQERVVDEAFAGLVEWWPGFADRMWGADWREY